VLQSCERPGSLDSSIVNGSRLANDFGLFFDLHPHIKLICFNGAEAEKSFMRYVMPQVNINGFKLVRLPSTSPANTQSFEQKKAAWEMGLAIV
jgi:hypoxanthine-DNA glycosylase